jgi:hypothetical protein
VSKGQKKEGRNQARNLQSSLDHEIVPTPTLGTSNVPILVVSGAAIGASTLFVGDRT